MSSFLFRTPGEFSFKESLHFLKRSPVEMLHKMNDDAVIKVIRIKDKDILFSVEEANKKNLKISLLHGELDRSLRKSLTDYVHEWLDLEADLQAFYLFAGKDKLLSPLVKKYAGYRIVRIPDLFECLCWAIIGQQINLRFAYSLKQRFVQQYGEKIIWHNDAYHYFPGAEKIAGIDPAALYPLQFSKQKALYLVSLAQAFTSGSISKEALSALSFDEAKERLVQLKGIGNWTANYALMKTFHFQNAFPAEDAGLHQAVKKQLQLKTKPTADEVRKLFKKYKGWEAYATLYFWRSLSDD